MDVTQFARSYLEQLRSAIDEIDPQSLEAVVALLLEAERDGRTVVVMGNGGSASTASHLASDLCRTGAGTGRRRLRAHSLTDSIAAFYAG